MPRNYSPSDNRTYKPPLYEQAATAGSVPFVSPDLVFRTNNAHHFGIDAAGAVVYHITATEQIAKTTWCVWPRENPTNFSVHTIQAVL